MNFVLSVSSILRNPLTARSITVDVISRISARSSISVPASAGVKSLGGSYLTAITPLPSGSLPLVYQTYDIKNSVKIGSPKNQLSEINHKAFFKDEGSFRIPFGSPTTIVSPSPALRLPETLNSIPFGVMLNVQSLLLEP